MVFQTQLVDLYIFYLECNHGINILESESQNLKPIQFPCGSKIKLPSPETIFLVFEQKAVLLLPT